MRLVTKMGRRMLDKQLRTYHEVGCNVETTASFSRKNFNKRNLFQINLKDFDKISARYGKSHSRPQSFLFLLAGWAWARGTSGSGYAWFYWIGSNKGNPIKSVVLKWVWYGEFETADLIGFRLFDSIQSKLVSPQPLVPRAQPQPATRERGSRDLGI